MNHYMCDEFSRTGHSLDSFMKAAEGLDNCTTMTKLNFDEVTILHKTAHKEGKIKYKELLPGNVFQAVGNGVLALNSDFIINAEKVKETLPEFFREITEKNTTAFRFSSYYGRDELYFLGDTIYKTLGAKITDIGGKFLRSNSVERDIALAAVLEEDSFTCQGVVRSYGGVKKILAIYTDRFKRVPMTFLGETIKSCEQDAELFATEVKYWNMNNRQTEIYFEFPQFAKILKAEEKLIPGIKLTTSDTAYKQTVVTACWRNPNGKAENHYVQTDFTLKHSTEVTIEMLVNYTKEALKIQKQFFENYCDYSQKLRTVPVDGKRAFKKAVLELTESAQYKKLIGQKGHLYLVNTLCENYNSKIHTKEEVFDEILRFPEKIKPEMTSASQREGLRTALLHFIV